MSKNSAEIKRNWANKNEYYYGGSIFIIISNMLEVSIMDFVITPLSKGESTELVTENNTAIKFASGTAPVYATPALVGLLENAAVKAVGSQLPEGFGTVGISMNVKHVSATPIGMTVKATATLTEQNRKKLTFKVEAYDEGGLVGEGIHERFIIETAPFLAKAAAKKTGMK